MAITKKVGKKSPEKKTTTTTSHQRRFTMNNHKKHTNNANDYPFAEEVNIEEIVNKEISDLEKGLKDAEKCFCEDKVLDERYRKYRDIFPYMDYEEWWEYNIKHLPFRFCSKSCIGEFLDEFFDELIARGLEYDYYEAFIKQGIYRIGKPCFIAVRLCEYDTGDSITIYDEDFAKKPYKEIVDYIYYKHNPLTWSK